MEHIKGESRDQLVLFTETIDSVIDEKNPVRIIDAYVDKLDFKKLGFKLKESPIGRPSYSFGVLLKIFFYGYINKIRSSRKLENECRRNIELIWLTGRLSPDFKTLADFRRDNTKGITSLFKEFLKLCHKLDLISFKLAGIDGTKISAQNSMGNIYRRDNIEEIAKKIDEKIIQYLKELELNDQEEESEFEFLSRNIEKKLKSLKTRKGKVARIKEIFEADLELDVYYANDPDSRLGKDKGKSDVLYNAQMAVDEKHKLIVVAEVTNENNDLQQLSNIVNKVEEIKNELGVDNVVTIKVADAGYYSEKEILSVVDSGHEVYVPSPRDENRKRNEGKEEKPGQVPTREYNRENFIFNKEANNLMCPDGKLLVLTATFADRGRILAEYTCNNKECCNKDKCTKDKEKRRVKLSVRKQDMDRFDDNVRSELGKKIVGKRKELAEHPFGTIKRSQDHGYFLLKGKDKVNCEFNFTSFIYNFKRVLNIAGFDALLAAF